MACLGAAWLVWHPEPPAARSAGTVTPDDDPGEWHQTATQKTAAQLIVDHDGKRQPFEGAPLAAGDVVYVRLKADEVTDQAYVTVDAIGADDETMRIYPSPGAQPELVGLGNGRWEMPYGFFVGKKQQARGFRITVSEARSRSWTDVHRVMGP